MAAKRKYKKKNFKTNHILLDDFAKVAIKIREELEAQKKTWSKTAKVPENMQKLMAVLEDYEEHYGVKERK